MKKILLILVLIVVSILGANAQYAFMWTLYEDGVYNGNIEKEDVEFKITHVKTGCFVTAETSILTYITASYFMYDATDLTNCAPGLTVGDSIRFELRLKSSGKKADVTVAIPNNRSFDGDMYIEAVSPTGGTGIIDPAVLTSAQTLLDKSDIGYIRYWNYSKQIWDQLRLIGTGISVELKSISTLKWE